MFENDKVSWSRSQKTGKDDLGHPITEPASGFPVIVLGDWQEQEERIVIRPEGVGHLVDVKYYTAYKDGRPGDQVTPDGDTRAYIVKYRTRNRELFGSQVDHCEYGLAIIRPGVEA